MADWMIGDGLLRRTAGMKPVVKLTAKGRSQIEENDLTPFNPQRKRADHALHPELMVKLRALRDEIADRDAYTRNEVCPDHVLMRIANKVPFNRSELLRIAGFNPTLFDRCGTSILQALEDYRSGLDSSSDALKLPSRLRVTYELAGQGYTIDEIASTTARQPSTISGHVSDLIELHAIDDIEQFVNRQVLKAVEEAIEANPTASLKDLRVLTGGGIPYSDLRIAGAWIRSRKKAAS
jgi:ATP-dependent DNA helicase RecQ